MLEVNNKCIMITTDIRFQINMSNGCEGTGYHINTYFEF